MGIPVEAEAIGISLLMFYDAVWQSIGNTGKGGVLSVCSQAKSEG